jgi:hypothetical protein
LLDFSLRTGEKQASLWRRISIRRSGKNTRWRKGQRSPNPGGRPRYGLISAYLRQALESGDGDKIARSLLNQAKKGNLRAIGEVIDRTEGKAKQTVDVAVEKNEPVPRDFRNMSRDELVEHLVDTGLRLIGRGLESLKDEDLDGPQLRKAAPRLRELHKGLTNLVEALDKGGNPTLEGHERVKNKDNTQDAESEWRTVQTTEGGGSVRVWVGH